MKNGQFPFCTLEDGALLGFISENIKLTFRELEQESKREATELMEIVNLSRGNYTLKGRELRLIKICKYTCVDPTLFLFCTLMNRLIKVNCSLRLTEKLEMLLLMIFKPYRNS